LCSFAQNEKISPSIINKITHTINLIKGDSITKLSEMVYYPLKRANPLPDIFSEREFIASYHILFDDEFKRKILTDSISDIFFAEGNYAILNGEVWFDENGIIIAMGSSTSEKKIQDALTRKIFDSMYAWIKPWIRNCLVIKSDGFLARVDETEDGYRYISWGKGKTISEKPDIILYKGDKDFMGTQGGVQYTFKNGDWSYVFVDDYLSERPETEGVHLLLLYKGKEKKSYKCEELK